VRLAVVAPCGRLSPDPETSAIRARVPLPGKRQIGATITARHQDHGFLGAGTLARAEAAVRAPGRTAVAAGVAEAGRGVRGNPTSPTAGGGVRAGCSRRRSGWARPWDPTATQVLRRSHRERAAGARGALGHRAGAAPDPGQPVGPDLPGPDRAAVICSTARRHAVHGSRWQAWSSMIAGSRNRCRSRRLTLTYSTPAVFVRRAAPPEQDQRRGPRNPLATVPAHVREYPPDGGNRWA